ncbi:MAG: TetR/AcrR family transcriptional regulator [Gemmatimonadota bacterium]|jgi:AcrR family transcriptional regulator|nr:MAG: TetR/AcrR family transcriptional regulator [Gemmatimonadota bacterium]
MRTLTVLEKRDWLDAGLELLRVRGIGGVQVGPLCRRVGVSKGSFYHHFESRDCFLERLIEYWFESCAPRPDDVAAFAAKADLEDRVGAVLDFIREHDLGRYDPAMRTWAEEDEQAKEAVARMDDLRLAAIARLFEADGWPREAAMRRAQTMYYFIAGRYEIYGLPPTAEEGSEFARMLTCIQSGAC